MQLNQTMLYLHNGDRITYLNNQCSVRTIVHILEAKGYSVAVCLYPNNAIKTLTNDERQSAVMIGDALLIIHPPPPVAEPAEVESDGRSTVAISSWGESDGTTSMTLDDKSSGHLSITNYSQVDPDFPMG
jgi:hypothetical protein